MPRRRVVIESPLRASTTRLRDFYTIYAKMCAHHSLALGEAPFASHLLYAQPGMLDDDVPDERKTGIECGYAWGDAAQTIAVYIDHGISDGMRAAIHVYLLRHTPLVYRRLRLEDKSFADVDCSIEVNHDGSRKEELQAQPATPLAG